MFEIRQVSHYVARSILMSSTSPALQYWKIADQSFEKNTADKMQLTSPFSITV